MTDEARRLDSIKEGYAEKYGFHDAENYVFKSRKGLDRAMVEEISWMKGEPEWMRALRLRALEIFLQKPLPTWGADLSAIDFDDIYYYVKASNEENDWDDVPETIKNTFDRLGIPEAERRFLAGVGAQYESEVVYHNIRKDLESKGILFLGMDAALKEHPDIVKAYFGTVVPPGDNKFAALNSAVWSGGSFIYVPPGVHVEMPLQAYFRINTQNMGQFERTLIIVDEGAFVHYVEGCLPPGEQVSLGHTWTPIETVRPGDTVMDSAGCESRVESARSRPFTGDLVEIQPLSKGNTFRLTPEHPVLAVRRRDVVVKRRPRGTSIVADSGITPSLSPSPAKRGRESPAGVATPSPVARGRGGVGVNTFAQNARPANIEGTWLPEVDTRKLVAARPEFIPAGDLERGDFIVFPISKVTRTDPRYTPDVLRLLGYYLARGGADSSSDVVEPPPYPSPLQGGGNLRRRAPGDSPPPRQPSVGVPSPVQRGRVAEGQEGVSFSFGEDEHENIADVVTLVEAFTGKRAMLIRDASRSSVEVRVYSQKLLDLCLESCGKFSHEKKLSQAIMELPPELQAHLLAAYLRGDGSAYERKLRKGHSALGVDPLRPSATSPLEGGGRVGVPTRSAPNKKHAMVRASTASQTLAWQLQELLARQGHYATISIRKGGKDTIRGREITRRDQYILYTSPDKQMGEVRRAGDAFLVPIKRTSRVAYDGPVFNIELASEPNAYLVRGFAVHNCTAPIYSSDSLHSAVVEIIVKRGGRCRYSTIQNWSTNVYNLVTKRTMAYADATMEWVDGNLGCLEEGSTVTTPTGIRSIESLEIGDEVLAYDETTGALCFRAVLGKRFSGYQPVHTVSAGERTLRVTANHPFYSYVYDPDAPKKLGRYRLAYVRADCLSEAIIPRMSVDYGEPHRLNEPVLETTFKTSNQYASNLVGTRVRPSKMTADEYTTDRIMWLFGYWVGDGNMEVKHGITEGVIRWAKVGFSTPKQDRAREHLMGTMTALIDIEPVERSDGVYLAWNSKELAEFFIANGFGGKAIDKRVPRWIWSIPESQRLAFIAGYLDADGTVVERHFSLKSANSELLEDIASLLVTLGITSRLYAEFETPREVEIMGLKCIAHGSYRLSFPVDERFFPHISDGLRERAMAVPSRRCDLKRQVGRSTIILGDDVEIVPVTVSEPTAEAVPTWDIEVEGTGNFISQGFIVHNSKVTMKYPAVFLMEPGAHGEVLSIAFAGEGQHQDAGAKMVHAAPNTTSTITSKSISKDGGRATYRGLLKVRKGAYGVRSKVACDALLLDPESRSDTYPVIEIEEDDVTVGHEATVSKVGEDQLFYLMSRGLSEEEANAMVVNGFIEPLVKELPMEYALELNRLIQLQMEGSVG